MNIPNEIKKRKFNIDYLLVVVVELGVTINPVAFLVIQSNHVKLIPVNHSSSLDKLLDYVPDLMEKTNQIMNHCIQNRKEETQKILKEMQDKHDKSMKKEEEDKKAIEEKVEKEIEKMKKMKMPKYEETMEDE